MSTSYTGPIRDWTRDWHKSPGTGIHMALRMAQPFYVPPKEVTTTREVKLATQAMKESSPSRQLAISRSSASLNSNYPEHSRLMLRDSRTHNPRYAFCTKSTERSDSLRRRPTANSTACGVASTQLREKMSGEDWEKINPKQDKK